MRIRFPESALVFGIRICLGLVLLTPLAGMPEMLYAFTVGKALYARSLIAAAFALWAVLAAVRPVWRPKLNLLTILLAATLVTGLLSALFGVSLQRSLWSGYPRMGGLVDVAHWLAFLVLLSAMLRTVSQWMMFLNLNLLVGLAAALVAVVRFHFPEGAMAGWWPEPHHVRASGTFANPLFLGAHMQAVALLAAGFLASSFAGASAPGSLRLFWLVTAVSALWALMLSGSMGAMAGLCAGVGGAAFFHALSGPSPAARRGGRIVLGALVLFAVALSAVLVLDHVGSRDGEPQAAQENRQTNVPLFDRMTDTDRIGSTLGKRLDNWTAGLQAFADRPLLGWGPGNYLAAASRYDKVAAKTNRARDRAHNEAMERLVTGGVIGLAAWLGLWAATFAAVLRSARQGGPNGTLAVFAGAALLGWLVQGMTSFYSPASWMQHVLLLGFLAFLSRTHENRKAEKEDKGNKGDRKKSVGAHEKPFGWVAVRAVLATVVVGLSGASISTGFAIHAGSAALYRAETAGPFLAELRNAIRAFEPLAVHPRILLFENIAPNWTIMHAQDPAKAFRLLAWAEAEEREAIKAEPRNWQLLHALAKMYDAVAKTSPQYAPRARYWYERSREVAPFQDPLMQGIPGGPGRP